MRVLSAGERAEVARVGKETTTTSAGTLSVEERGGKVVGGKAVGGGGEGGGDGEVENVTVGEGVGVTRVVKKNKKKKKGGKKG